MSAISATMPLQQQQAIIDFLFRVAEAQDVQLQTVKLLTGGAIQENWLLELEVTGGNYAGHLAVVLRSDAASVVSSSHSRAQEFALLQAAFAVGVTVPEPLWLGEKSVFGRDF